MACVAVASLVRTLELELLQPHPRPILQENETISCNKEAIQSLHQKLGFLVELLDESRMDGFEAIKNLETKLRDMAFRVEDEIELQIAHLYEAEEEFGTPIGPSSSSCLKLDLILQQAIQDIDAIKEDLLMKIKLQPTNTTTSLALDDVLLTSEVDSSQPAASDSDNKMVGKDEEVEIIKKMLIDHGLKMLEVVSIIGMGGIGKTTLARRVYEYPSVASHFDKRAWVVASQLHNKRQMLVGLLNSMGYYEDSGRNVAELAEQLYRGLWGKRYLVVIDDVWSGEAWDDVIRCFPDDGNGSRVLLTTRLAYVANYCSTRYHFSHQMQLLNPCESWDLFCEKASRSRGGVEFETMGKSIVEKCQGLPLAIVVAANLFSKLTTLFEWNNMVETLNLSSMTTIVEACSKIFSLSYNQLPHHLKACFLYLGVFPKGKVIYVKDLVRLWAVEGLIESESLDVVVERYINELLDRNLILASKRSSCGRKIKAIRMHGVLHALCVREAQNENLLHVVTENGSKFPRKGDFRWLSIQSTDFETSVLDSSSLIKCRSIFCFSEVKTLYLKNFNLLRVFYFTNASMCKKILDVVHLRYLPPVIRYFRTLKLFRAWNLQTHSFYAADGRNYLKFPQQQGSHGLPKLVLKPYQCTTEFFRKNPYLKEVKITGERRDCNDCIENLVHLPQLEGLYINCNVLDYRIPHMISINNHIAHLNTLKVLSFRSMSFEWKGINVLCMLPRLEILSLFSSGVGEEWELLEEDVFTELIVLQVFSTDLMHWKASDYNFPKLERLVLSNCCNLREIPEGFGDILTLKSIELERCLLYAVTSAEQIEENQRDWGNENMIVIQHHTIKPPKLESSEHKFDEYESVNLCLI